MIETNSPVIGASKHNGIWTPCSVYIGSSKKEQVTAIDMLSPTLDPRVTYQCASSHSYKAQPGLIAQAEPDEWPLEYIDGVPVGRHEPEPERTNLLLNNINPPAGRWTYNRALAGGTTVTGPDGSQVGTINPQIATDAGLYQPTGRDRTKSYAFSVFANATVDNRMTCSNGQQTMRVIIPGAPLEVWQYGTGVMTASTEAGTTYSASLYNYNGVIGELFAFWAMMMEEGTFSTSPILTDTTTVTRAAATAVIDTSAASSVDVIFSDGTTETHQTPDTTFTLPQSSRNWGERYIMRIEMRG